MDEPLISVIMPVYNVKDKLDKSISSVAGQTYKNLEIILVDDGSADGSGNICDEWAKKDQRITAIHKENGGVATARDRGLKASKGEYIGFVDSDDWIHPQMYEYLLHLLLDNDADISCGGIIKTETETDCRPETEEKITVYDRDEFVKKFFKIGSQEIVYYVWNKLYKREVAVDSHENNNFSVGEDVIATYTMLQKAKRIVTSSVPVYYYRLSSGATSAFSDRYFELKDVWKRVEKMAAERGRDDLLYARINLQRIDFTILSELAISGEYKNPKYIQRRDELKRELKKHRRALTASDIAFSRKLMINWFCINYESAAFLMSKLMKRRQ